MLRSRGYSRERSVERLGHGGPAPRCLRGDRSGRRSRMIGGCLPCEASRSRGWHGRPRVHRRGLIRVHGKLCSHGGSVIDLGREHGGPHRLELSLVAESHRVWRDGGGHGVRGDILGWVRRRVAVDSRRMHVVLLMRMRVRVLALVRRSIVAATHRGRRCWALTGCCNEGLS